MTQDSFDNVVDTLTAPATTAVPVQPDDRVALAAVTRAVYVGTGGDVSMQGKHDDGPRLWRNVPNGALLPFRAAMVYSTGTTATDLLALY